MSLDDFSAVAMFPTHSPRFEPLRQSDDCESFLELKDNSTTEKSRPQGAVSSLYVVLTVLMTCIASLMLGIWAGTTLVLDADKFCIKRISQHSPILDAIPLSLDEVHFNGSFLHETVFRRPASPEVDAAWQSLGVDYRSGIISHEEGIQAGLSDDHVHIREKYGGGFVVNVEGLHHLHCLNLLRQSLYYNFEYYSARAEGAFVNKESIFRLHLFDTGVLGQVWWNKDAPTAFPDFNTKHTCKDFEEVRRWAFERQAPVDIPGDWLMPPKSLEDALEEMP